jgi:hypothetical protein
MNGQPTIDAQRPWPGLLPFTEDARMFFHGREAETDELFRLIEREPLTVLFGQSGLGKSSLLNAGVFPRLRRAGYLPVYMRLSLDAQAPALIDQLWQALMSECTNHEVSATAIQRGDSFWQYLHRPATQFLNPHGRPVVPVLAFDQFEEIFTLGRQTAEQTARTQVLLQQLGELIENRLPPALESKLTEQPELLDQFDLLRQNVKIVFTFREDYLADFEGLKTLIRPIMQNRMRLAPMRGDRAAEAIRQAGGSLLSAPVAARIVRFVGGEASVEKLEDIPVEPALLSLVCRELNEQRIARGQAEISADLIQGENTQQIIAQFYSQGFAGLDIRVRRFVEDRLLTAAGYRDSCALDNALAEPGVSQAAIQTLVDRRILRREERGGLVRLELIHDVLAIVAKASRDARREAAALEAAQQLLAQQRRRQRIIGAWAAVLVAGLVGVSWLAVVATRGKKEAVAAQKRADQQAKLATEQKQVAVNEESVALAEKSRAVDAEQRADAAKTEADEAKDDADNQAAEKEKQRWHAVEWAAAADEQLDNHGSGEQLRACFDSTNRLADDPPPPASMDYMVGVWHVDNEVGSAASSTDMEWRRDGTCVTRHMYAEGHEIDFSGDVCTYQYKTLGEHEFEIDWQSKKLPTSFGKQLIFRINSPTRMRNINIGYDAFRIVCPAEELTIRERQLVNLEKQADQNPGKLAPQLDLATGFDKLGTAQAAQGDPVSAAKDFDQEMDVCQKLAPSNSGVTDCLRRSAQSFGQVADQQFRDAVASDQSGKGQQGIQQANAAITSYKKSLAIWQQLVHSSPNDVDAEHSAAMVSDNEGIALFWIHRNAEGLDAIRAAVHQLENIVDAHHASPKVSSDLVMCLYGLSQRSDNPAEVKDSLRKAVDIVNQLDREHQLPEDMAGTVQFLQSELAKLH